MNQLFKASCTEGTVRYFSRKELLVTCMEQEEAIKILKDSSGIGTWIGHLAAYLQLERALLQ